MKANTEFLDMFFATYNGNFFKKHRGARHDLHNLQQRKQNQRSTDKLLLLFEQSSRKPKIKIQ